MAPFLLLVVITAVILPLQAAMRHLKVYKLRGSPHMIFDIGTGGYLLSVLLLVAAQGQRQLYLLVLPTVVMLCIVQAGGYLPEKGNTQKAREKKN